MENITMLAGSETHGFRTIEELNVNNIMEEAKARWLRPNEIYAMLRNYKYFTINAKPVNLPRSGTIVLFDRKMLRSFRKDGHNWKKKKDRKTVKEAHEHLKVGNKERIHVYYAHGEDNPTFVRRCYWLLDKALEHIVLVHYRETQELQGSPITPLHSNSSSALSDPSVSWVLSDVTNSGAAPACYTAEEAQEGPADSITFGNHEMRLHEINTLEWEELLAPDGSSKLSTPNEGKDACLEQQNQYETTEITSGGSISSANQLCQENSFRNFFEPVPRANSIRFNLSDHACLQRMDSQSNSDLQSKVFQSMYMGNGCEPLNIKGKDRLQSQDSFEIWMNSIMTDSPGSLDEQILQSSSPISHEVSTSPVMDHLQSSVPGKILSITDVSPAWALSTEETKILITGIFGEGHLHLAKSDIYCVCGDVHVRVEIVQSGVFRCFVSPHTPGVVDLYLSFDGHHPISQVLTFEYRAPSTHDRMVSSEEKSKWEEFKVQMRLAHLLFSTSKRLSVMSSKVSANTLNEAKTFASRTSHIAAHWAYMIQSIEDNKISHKRAKDQLFELALMNRLYEWLLEGILEGCKASGRDDLGHGVIHLCAILDYWWAVYPYAWSGLSLDYRDKFGWTALHWAAYYGREKMAATLLSAGVKPYLVTDPTSENLGGCTAADLASKNGHDGLAAYLAEKALLNHFEDMTIAGNVSGSLQTSTPHSVNLGSVSEEELYLKDSLTAYRTAADAAARIHAAFREHSFKLRTNAVQFSNPEDDARNIVAAMKIQNAFRNYETRKKMAAAARIQHRFRTWKIRKDFLTLRRHAIKIQAVFRGFQVRRQYRKIVWSVGVLEKAILRWRMKRKGFRGLKICPVEDGNVQEQEESVVEEAFFRASRKQAEERIERSVVRVQAMFRSRRAQQEYRRMKLAYNQARLEYEGFVSPEINMS